MGVLIALQVSASDHIDGPVTTSHRVADLTDLYAFPTPDRRGSLTVILDAYPLVPEQGHFTDKVNYTIYVRRASIVDDGGRTFFETGDEVALTCTFRTPEVTADHVVTCRTSNGASARSAYEVVPVRAKGLGFRVYSGMRADPFFFNADFATDALEGKLAAPDDDNVMTGVSILTIVVEIDLQRLFRNPPAMLAVAAETTTRDAPGAPLRRLDRVGRPEITNVSLAARNAPDLRDRFNRERPFGAPAATVQLFQARLAENIAFYDGLDGRRDWKDADRGRLATLMAADFLVVDFTRPCRPQSFLEIETALLRHKAHETCGGRRPDDDIMDTLFSLYVAGLSGRRVRDGVDHPAASLSPRFPYLAAPDLGVWNGLKAWIARRVLSIPDSR